MIRRHRHTNEPAPAHWSTDRGTFGLTDEVRTLRVQLNAAISKLVQNDATIKEHEQRLDDFERALGAVGQQALNAALSDTAEPDTTKAAAACDWDGETYCVEHCGCPATHRRILGMADDTPVAEMVCCAHASDGSMVADALRALAQDRRRLSRELDAETLRADGLARWVELREAEAKECRELVTKLRKQVADLLPWAWEATRRAAFTPGHAAADTAAALRDRMLAGEFGEKTP